MTLEKLQVIIEAQTKAYYEELKKVQQQTKSATSAVEAQTNKIKSAFGKIGKAVAVAFSVTAIINFSRSCIQLGSDLAEVQNVVDVTFGSMSETINQFARNALEEFGLSETSAKRYTSTMGAMLKSMGLATNQAADMSMQITGLAADMASFYNLDNDVAFEKIRAGISGETEPLKQLGINMSVANLQAYALSQGITKAYNSMTQQEQALLRYNYLMSVTADAQGDFARTSDGWANQVRVLTERWNALKATIGQGLIAVLTPVIKVLNQVLAKILTVTDAFSNMISKITGKNTKTTTTAVGGIADSADTATDSVGALGGATDKAGKSAKKAAKEYAGLANFDEIHSLTKNDGSDSGGSGSSGGGGAGDALQESIVDAANETDDSLNPALEKLLNRLKELQQLFKEGFKAGLGDVNFDGITSAIEGIKKSLKEIFTDPEVAGAANNYLNTMAYTLGQMAGATASIGITIATNILGGINKYLDQNKERIKKHLVSVFDISSEIMTIQGNFAQAAANIFSAFGGENGQQATANLIGIFADAYMGVQEITLKFSRDIMDVITRPFIDNQDQLKEVLDGSLGVIASVLGTIKDTVDTTVDKINEVYDSKIKPFYDAIAAGLSDTLGKFLDFWQGNVQPMLDSMASTFDSVVKSHLQPVIDQAIELIGTIAEAVTLLWNNVLKPLIDWIIANVLPKVLPVLESIWNTVSKVFGYILDAIGGLLKVIKGIIDFLIGVFTGDWSRAWEGIKEIVSGIWDAIGGIILAALNLIKGIVETVLTALSSLFSVIWNGIKDLISFIWGTIKNIVTSAITAVQSVISTAMNSISTIWSSIWNTIKTTVTTIFNAIKSTIGTVINAISTTISTVLNSIKTTFSTVFNAVKTTVTTIFNGIKNTITTVMGTISSGISTALNSIKTVWSNVWNGMKTTVTNIFTGIWNAIKGTINSIIRGIESMANGVINGINAMIGALNNLSFDVPDWVPGMGGNKFGFNIPTLGTISIPKLATGGVVDSATIAMIGEAGQEAVVPLENNTGWMDKVAARIGEIISVNMRAIIGEMDQGGEYQTIQTIVKLDSKTLVDQTDKYRRRKGYQMANA